MANNMNNQNNSKLFELLNKKENEILLLNAINRIYKEIITGDNHEKNLSMALSVLNQLFNGTGSFLLQYNDDNNDFMVRSYHINIDKNKDNNYILSHTDEAIGLKANDPGLYQQFILGRIPRTTTKIGNNNMYLFRYDDKSFIYLINSILTIDNDIFMQLGSVIEDVVINTEKMRKKDDLANRDGLSGILNRRAFNEKCKSIELSQDKKIDLIIGDLFRLKHVNDILGHTAGDIYIISVARILKRYFKDDYVYRIGGDEFAIICENRSMEYVEYLLHICQEEIEKIEIRDSDGIKEQTSLDAGVAWEYPGNIIMNNVIEKADEKLRQSKTKKYKSLGLDRRK